MIKSMTAFSQASNIYENITAEVTIRSYNSKYLDMVLHCPESCQGFEEDIKKIILQRHSRGRVDIRLSITDTAKEQDLFEVDEPAAASYHRALLKIREDQGLEDSVSLSDMLSARNIIVPSKTPQDARMLYKAIEPAIKTASEQLEDMRKKEGENLYADLCSRMDYIESQLKIVEAEAAKIPPLYKKRLEERISVLTADTDIIDPIRLAQEAAILADKSDVSEEIIRLKSHIKQFRDILDADESQGRKMNFLIQEFNREFNTIGSKAGNAALSHKVVDLKSELEKIREQVQNIE